MTLHTPAPPTQVPGSMHGSMRLITCYVRMLQLYDTFKSVNVETNVRIFVNIANEEIGIIAYVYKLGVPIQACQIQLRKTSNEWFRDK